MRAGISYISLKCLVMETCSTNCYSSFSTPYFYFRPTRIIRIFSFQHPNFSFNPPFYMFTTIFPPTHLMRPPYYYVHESTPLLDYLLFFDSEETVPSNKETLKIWHLPSPDKSKGVSLHCRGSIRQEEHSRQFCPTLCSYC